VWGGEEEEPARCLTEPCFLLERVRCWWSVDDSGFGRFTDRVPFCRTSWVASRANKRCAVGRLQSRNVLYVYVVASREDLLLFGDGVYVTPVDVFEGRSVNVLHEHRSNASVDYRRRSNVLRLKSFPCGLETPRRSLYILSLRLKLIHR